MLAPIAYGMDVERVRAPDLERFFTGWRTPPSIEKRLEILQAADAVVLAWSGRELVGFVTAISDGVSWAYIPLLEVLGAHQGRGVGKELMRRMLDHYSGLYGIDLVCDETLVPFYEQVGMRPLRGMAIRNHSVLR